ncbi:putative manganese-dependent inorganic diphosphatase [Geomonas sp. Red69]|uniref:putative manganese-dependent inorganic diphosphatase n=1 Tax=Geomonas diazotrophica TaxID=2843197 RepID=UPI001C0FC89B|nr:MULTISPECIES: putative manganese-dependent inorganic diphosphatase [Geomonas]MBU5635695.1 putative manganese-dependent inorganic diphosphatase [Geomonas diazotrophica]QXE87197.1 putative manganese-dependent inorganic diphosphatase [Geomonas nitrogeniifigens]
MDKQIFVIGHRNPDTDSIASALAYAHLKRALGNERVTAAMAGNLNPQTTWLLGRLGIDAPLYLADVHPKVRDVIQRTPITVAADAPLLTALEQFHHNAIRVLPVLDAASVPKGVIPLRKIAERSLVTGADSLRLVSASLASLAACLSGSFLAGSADAAVESLHLFVGAMAEESFVDRISGFDPATLVVVTGDRTSIQKASIERGVRLLVVTGGLPVAEDVVRLAQARGVALLSTPLDTAATVARARLATPVLELAVLNFESVSVGEPLGRLRDKLLHSGESAVLALEEDGTLAGVATKSSLFAPLPYALILVDHNELSQSVPGAEDLEILEVIDHHKLGNPPTSNPIPFITAPVGSTCTIVASLYEEHEVEPPAQIAALLLAGILSDTVILKSPTTTPRDRATVARLAAVAGLDWESFGAEIFAASGALSGYGSPERVIGSDFKLFSQGELTFGVGQVEVFGFAEFNEMKAELRKALAARREKDGLELAGLMVTDISTESTMFLMEGGQAFTRFMGYPQPEPHVFEMKGVMSRKKQLVPHLIKVLGGR